MKYWWLTLAVLLPWAAAADPAGVIRLQTPLQVDAAYDRIYKALEAERFWVVHEANLGEQFARNAQKWGVDYNRNRLGAVRAMVFSNIEWANTLANAEPDLLALWPLHLVIYERGGLSLVVLPRLSAMATGSPGESRARELEAEVRRILQQALAD
jgi:hypothetical protein